MLAVSNSVFLCNIRSPVVCPVRKLSTAVLWRAARRLTCLFAAVSKARVHDVTSTISHYKETVNCQHVTFWPRCQCPVHWHAANQEPHRRVSFEPLPFWCLCYSSNVYAVLSVFITAGLRCCPNVITYPLDIFLFCTCWCVSVSIIAIVWMFLFVCIVILYMCFSNSLNFCSSLCVLSFFMCNSLNVLVFLLPFVGTWFVVLRMFSFFFVSIIRRHNHHHQVPEGLGVFPVPWSSRWSWSLHLFLGRPMFLRSFGLYCSACFGSLFVSILCTCCSHFW